MSRELIAAGAGVASSAIVYNLLNNRINRIESQLPPLSEASYIVFADNGMYRAKNGKTGQIETSDASAARVIQYAINALAGGQIFIKEGIYDCAGTLLSIANKSNIRIKGAGIGKTILKNTGIIKNSATPTYRIQLEDLTIDANNTVSTCLNLATNSFDFRIRNVELKNSKDSFLMYWDGVDNLIVENCIFYDGGLSAAADNCSGTQLTTTEGRTIFRNCTFIKERALGGGMLTTGSTGNLLIDGCTFIDRSGNSYAAVSIENSFGPCKDIQVIGCRAFGKAQGIQIGNSRANQIERAIIMGCITTGTQLIRKAREAIISDGIIFNSDYGFFLDSNTVAKLKNCVAKNTNFYGSPFVADKAGLYIDGNNFVEVEGLHVYDDQATPTTPHAIRGSSTEVYLRDIVAAGPFVYQAINLGSGNVLKWYGGKVNGDVVLGTYSVEKTIKGVSGYVTENSGVATLAAGSTRVTVNHGLVAAPSKVFITPRANITAWVENITGTSFDIVVATAPTTNITFSWYAEV
jgi:hypothetical protein